MRKIAIIAFILLSMACLFAGTTGKISGVVLDGETRSPLPGVNVVISGSMMGAATDMEGNFFIINIPPGIYSLKAMMMGYATTTVTDIRVKVGLTTDVNFKMNPAMLEGEEVTIVAEKPLIQKDITSSRSIIGADEIANMPVESFGAILSLQTGVVRGSGGEMHVRGGRSNEVSYLVDGISVTDPYSQSMAVTVENSAIQEMEFVSGTFNAEYGQAMSGIVNIITKEGSSEYHGMMKAYVGDYFSTNKDIFYNIDEINPFAIRDVQASLSGPVPFTNNRLTFFANGRHYDTDSYLYGMSRYVPSDSNSYPGDDPAEWIVEEHGTGDPVPMSNYFKWNTQAKLAWNVSPSMKLTYNVIASDAQSQSYSHKFKFNPDGRSTSYGFSSNQILTFTHTLSARTFYQLKYSNFYNSGQAYVYEDPYDSRYVDPERFDTASGYQYYMGGMSMGHFDRYTRTNIFKFEFTSQVNKTHQVKGGAEFRTNKLFMDSFSVLVDNATDWKPFVPDVTNFAHDRYSNYPRDFSAYLQDKIELKDMIINLGVRFEYFDPNSVLLTDMQDPNMWKPNRYQVLDAVTDGGTYRVKVPVRIDPATGAQTLINPNTGDPIGANYDSIRLLVLNSSKVEGAQYLNGVTLQDTLTGAAISSGSLSWFEDTTPKFQISPRIGIAYPITERGVIHISYGHFLQIPNYSYLYANPEFEVNVGGNVSTTMGNASLEPQQTVSYEIGLQQQLTDNVAIDITGFFKDIRNLLGTEIYKTYSQDMYALYVNRDYGNVRGLTVALDKRYSNFVSAGIDYTYSVSEGNASDPNSTYYNQQSGREPEKQLIPLSWDQRHTLNFTVSISKPKDWGLSVVGQYGSGLPYTPTSAGLQGFQNLQTTFENSGRKPSTLNIDLRMHKDFYMKSTHFTIFCNLYNLLDELNERLVYSDTGRSTYTMSANNVTDTAGPNTISEYLVRPYYYAAPRSIRLGAQIQF